MPASPLSQRSPHALSPRRSASARPPALTCQPVSASPPCLTDRAGPRVSCTFHARSALARSPARSLTSRPHLSVPPSPTRPRPTAPANLAGITPGHASPRSSATSFKCTPTPPCVSPLHPAAATATLAPPPPRSAAQSSLCRRGDADPLPVSPCRPPPELRAEPRFHTEPACPGPSCALAGI